MESFLPVFTLKGHFDVVYSVVFSPVGNVLASGSADKTIRILDVESGKELRLLTGHENYVYCLAVSPSGVLVSGSGDKTIKGWDIQAGTLSWTLRGHDGKEGCTCKVYPGAYVEVNPFCPVSGNRGPVCSVAFLEDGQLASCGEFSENFTWDTGTGNLSGVLRTHSKKVSSSRDR